MLAPKNEVNTEITSRLGRIDKELEVLYVGKTIQQFILSQLKYILLTPTFLATKNSYR